MCWVETIWDTGYRASLSFRKVLSSSTVVDDDRTLSLAR